MINLRKHWIKQSRIFIPGFLRTFEIRGDEKVDEAGEEGWEEDHDAEAQP